MPNVLVPSFSSFRPLHPYATLFLDTFIFIILAVINLFSTAGAVQTLQWRAEQYYDDAKSGHDGYYIYNPNRGQPGEPRVLKVPPANATICSGWDGDCDAQHAFERKTQARAKVELGGVSCAWVAVAIYLIVWVYACVVVHRFRKAKKRSRVQMMRSGIASMATEKQENQQTYRYS